MFICRIGEFWVGWWFLMFYFEVEVEVEVVVWEGKRNYFLCG